MDNTTAIVVESTHEAYESYIYSLCLFANLSLMLYSIILGIAQEVEYIWTLRNFGLPSLLYILARFGSLCDQAMEVAIDVSTTGSITCNRLSIAANSSNVFCYVGTQGLLVARAYALCKGHKVMTGLLAFTFFCPVVSLLIAFISFPNCFMFQTDEQILLDLLNNIFVFMNDTLVGGICLWNIWEIWKTKHKTGLRGGHDLASILINQVITRFIFVVTFSLTAAIIVIIPQTSENLYLVASLLIFQKTLSPVLLCDFTLGLRQRNSAAGSISLPTLQIQSVLQYTHQSFIVALGDNNDIPNVNADDDGLEPGSVPLDHVGHLIQDQAAEIIISETA